MKLAAIGWTFRGFFFLLCPSRAGAGVLEEEQQCQEEFHPSRVGGEIRDWVAKRNWDVVLPFWAFLVMDLWSQLGSDVTLLCVVQGSL